MKILTIFAVLAFTTASTASAFWRELTRKFFHRLSPQEATVSNHLMLMLQYINLNQRPFFNTLFRTDAKNAFPNHITPDQFFNFAYTNKAFRDALKVKVVSGPRKISSQQMEFVYETTYCDIGLKSCTKKRFKRKAIISPKSDSKSGWGFDSLRPA
ncbi:unnamed protein product [Caenorhabditis bovis]|uniref:Cathepsin propeptide inhibitor domain-containing protein n=1 Tax=Caenorhabditis bovis TaxID=2654633 RepID=A0A8S1ER56_9PELO|nr:unnamed protein product [Caenorhabditis bovis]